MRTLPRALISAALVAAAAGALPALAGGTATPQANGHKIGHVWVINIENKNFDETYGPSAPTHIKALLAQGQLLTQYYGIGHVSLDNYIAELSGQAPNMITQADCPDYVDQQPGVPGPDGQSLGQGCVYPAWVQALPNQLDAAGLSWKGYMEDMGNDASRYTISGEADRCGAPGNPSGTGLPDGTQTATATDQYAARHNPFVYFHSILDRECWTHVVPLTDPKAGLAADLASLKTTPNFSFITPDLCHDGHDDPCKDPNEPGGLAGVDAFLATYIPLIQASEAYNKDGLIVVTSDEAEATQSNPSQDDASSCCNEQPGYNTPMPGIYGPGGGRVGTLVVGKCVAPASTNDTPYNHYALLRSLEDLFGITQGGSDGKGHLGYAGQDGLKAFGSDVFAACGGKA